jgi:hypothetical protein
LDAEDGKHEFYRRRGFVGIEESGPMTNILPMFMSIGTIEDTKQ